MSGLKIVIVGTGNVAHQMGRKIAKSDHKLVAVMGRTRKNAQELSDILNCPYHSPVTLHKDPVDIYLIAVKDEAIEEVSKVLRNTNAIQIHMSGCTNMGVLQSKHRGIIWPLYSIRKEYDIDWSKIPLIIESSDIYASKKVKSLCEALGGKTYELNSEQRAHAHLLAVFINNFSKHFFSLIKKHQTAFGIDPSIYDEILGKTFEKIKSGEGLKKSLTGPARRNDKDIIKKHLSLLEDDDPMKELYQTFTKSILETYYGDELQGDTE